jgi:hypothetical protein
LIDGLDIGSSWRGTAIDTKIVARLSVFRQRQKRKQEGERKEVGKRKEKGQGTDSELDSLSWKRDRQKRTQDVSSLLKSSQKVRHAADASNNKISIKELHVR